MMKSSNKLFSCQVKISDYLNQRIVVHSSLYDNSKVVSSFSSEKGPIETTDVSKSMTVKEVVDLINDLTYTHWVEDTVVRAKQAVASGRASFAQKQIVSSDKPRKTACLAPSFSLTGGTRRRDDTRSVSSGITVVDVDHYSSDAAELENMAEKAKEIPEAFCCFRSPSKDGLKILCATYRCDSAPMLKDTDIFRLQSAYNEQIHRQVAQILGLPYGTDRQCSGAHIDAACVDPRRATFLPYEGYVYWTKDESEVLTINVDTTDAEESATIDGICRVVDAKTAKIVDNTLFEQSDIDSANIWFENSLKNISTCADGAGYQSLNGCAYIAGRLRAAAGWKIDEIRDRLVAAVAAQDRPDPDYKTRIFNGFSDGLKAPFGRDSWRAWQKAHEVKKTPVKKEKKIAIDIDEIDWSHYENMQFSFFKDKQPVETFAFSREACAKLMMIFWLKKYRFAGNGGIDLESNRTVDYKAMERIGSYCFKYCDEKGKDQHLSFRQAHAILGDSLGDTDVTIVNRLDLPAKKISNCQPFYDSLELANCYNMSPGLPTQGIDFNGDLSRYITPEAKRKAEVVADFCTSRFLDKAYPDPKYRQEKAEEESAYYFRYIYQAITDPAVKPDCAVVVLSEQRGTGKSTITLNIPQILVGSSLAGQMSQSQSGDDNARRFAWTALKGTLFCTFDDFEQGTDKIAAALRNIITSKSVAIETKGVQGHQEYTTSRLFFSTNSREFLKNLNSGTTQERRYHIFHVANVMRDENAGIVDHSCDEAMDIIKYYRQKSETDGLMRKDADLLSFRVALVHEFGQRAAAWEQKTGEKIHLDRALATREFQRQTELGLERNSIARQAAMYLLDQPGKRAKKREIYDFIRNSAKKGETLTEKFIAQRMEESGFFTNSLSGGQRFIKLSDAGLRAVSDENDLDEKISQLDELPIKDRMETIADLARENLITFELKNNNVVEIRRFDAPNLPYEVSLTDNSNIVTYAGIPMSFSDMDNDFDGLDDCDADCAEKTTFFKAF